MLRERVLWLSLPDTARVKNDPLAAALATRFSVYPVESPALIATAIPFETPTVLLLDLDKPTLSDLQLLREIKHDYPSMPIFLLTGASSEKLAVLAFRAGARDYFVKPVEPDLLLERVEICLNFLRKAKDKDLPAAPPAPPLSMRPNPPTPSARDLLQKIFQFIANNYQQKIALTDAARLVGMNQFQLCRMIRKETGVSFKEYLVNHRLQRVETCLLHTSASITDIAWAAGFSNLSNFQRLFRRKNGVTPREYRKNKHLILSLQESTLFRAKKYETGAKKAVIHN